MIRIWIFFCSFPILQVFLPFPFIVISILYVFVNAHSSRLVVLDATHKVTTLIKYENSIEWLAIFEGALKHIAILKQNLSITIRDASVSLPLKQYFILLISVYDCLWWGDFWRGLLKVFRLLCFCDEFDDFWFDGRNFYISGGTVWIIGAVEVHDEGGGTVKVGLRITPSANISHFIINDWISPVEHTLFSIMKSLGANHKKDRIFLLQIHSLAKIKNI